MKKIFLAFTATTILAVALFNNANAQQPSGNAASADARLSLSFNEGAMRFAYVPETYNDVATEASSEGLNMKALKDFQKSYRDASNVSWYKAENGALLASFTENQVNNSVAYDKKGRWLYSIKRYGEQNLAKDIRANVKSVYYDFNIANVEEVAIDNQTIYIIHLEDAKTLKTLRIAEGEIEEVQNLRKG